jgi:ParB family chromosome partitioning protein
MLDPDAIIVGERLRQVVPEEVEKTARSISKLGMRTPITIRFVEGKPLLVAGAQRLQAAKDLGWRSINAVEFVGDEREARMWEIAENLHRAELTLLECCEQMAEWVRLADEKPAQVDPVPERGGRGHTGGINQASRELGIERKAARRAVKIDSLAPEAKATAVKLGLADNQSALLEAAKAETADEQVEALKQRKERKRTATKDQPQALPSTSPTASGELTELERLSKVAELMEVGLEDVLRAHAVHKIGSPELFDEIKKGSVTLDGAAAMLLAIPRLELSELPFDEALAMVKAWFKPLGPVQQADVLAELESANDTAMVEVEAAALQPTGR